MSFEVIPASVPVYTEEWRRATAAPEAELPELTEQQRSDARSLSVSEEEYKRYHVLLRRTVLERQQRQGLKFGEFVQAVITPWADRFHVSHVSRRGTPSGWTVTIGHCDGGTVKFQCALETVEAVAEGSLSEQERHELSDLILRELVQLEPLGAAG